MRIYSSLTDAHSECIRDLSRSLVQPSSRVQSKVQDDKVHEAVGYSYMLPGSAFPVRPSDLVHTGIQLLPVWKKWAAGGAHVLNRWFKTELEDRIDGNDGKAPRGDALHPELCTYLTDGVPHYTYKERLPARWPSRVATALMAYPDTRRIFLPIYQPLDFDLISDNIRVPCTLGYSFRYRITEDGNPHLEVHLIQRSVDFNKFWLSDVGMAFYFGLTVQKLLAERDIRFYRLRQSDIAVFHHILSFHSFLQDEGEIF